MAGLWCGAMFGARVLPMAFEALPKGNLVLTSAALERTTAAYYVYSCASAHRDKAVRCDVFFRMFLESTCLCALLMQSLTTIVVAENKQDR